MIVSGNETIGWWRMPDKDYWDGRLEFLRAVRTGWCNEDYIGFLIERVWRIRKAVRLVDFGCGFGYIGLLMLPLLPEGSTYTGIDFSDALLEDAKGIFETLGYAADFVKADLNCYEPRGGFDMAVSQAVLRHIPNASAILGKMVDSVVEGGLVLCMETDLELEKAGLHISGFDYPGLAMTELYRKMYREEFAGGGRDYRVAVRIPCLMQEMGLKNVGVRMNDSVKFVNPCGDAQDHDRQFDALTGAWGWNRCPTPEEEHGMRDRLVQRGLTPKEAEAYMSGDSAIREYLMENRDSAYIVQVPGTLISYGTK